MAGTLVIDTLKSSASTPPVFKNTSDVEVGQLCRAWVNFNGSTSAIRASFNVSSITRNGAGDYTVNLTNAMPDANYSIGSLGCTASGYLLRGADDFTARTTTAFRLAAFSLAGTQQDSTIVNVSVFR